MTTRNFFSILSLIVLFSSIFSCAKPDLELVPVPVNEVKSTLPVGNRINIHFGTSTQQGCMYSFSNCVWIGWGNAMDMNRAFYTLQFDNSDEVQAEYGNFFPLTADFTLDAQNGLPPQMLKSGFYRFQKSADGRKTIEFSPENVQPVAPLVNPNNPQDNIGQLHNLAMQGIYTTQTKNEISAAGTDPLGARKMLTAKSVQFLATEADVIIDNEEQKQIETAAFDSNYDDHAAWLETSKLSANDRKEMRGILDMASEIQVNTPEQLSHFVQVMTEVENRLVQSTTLDDPKLMLSAVSVMKYSRYYWYWKTTTNDESASNKPWWKADVRGLIEGGIGQALVDSLFAALAK